MIDDPALSITTTPTLSINRLLRQVLLNQIAILEALQPLSKAGAQGTRELLRQRYTETAQLIRQHSSVGSAT